MGDDLSSSSERRYRAARTALDAALGRARRLRQDEAGDVVVQARAALLELAPAQPTPWWPGGWVCPGEPPALVFQTEAEALAARPDSVPPNEWPVRWTAVLSGDQVLDEAFWEDRPKERVLGAGADLAQWLAAAAASGMVGNAAYDAVKFAVGKPREPDEVPDGEPRTLRQMDIDVPPGAPPVLGQD
ncbi:hypothetical protein [Lentzea fradiae]|uniref:hypothetical protein n=1 Tax=Lentzea fradiae TaxID=200378 RepID=UPI00115FE488|nr:hypothetical protein [Lentzea fradiae]